MLKEKAKRRPSFTWVDDPLHPCYQQLVPQARPSRGHSCMKVSTLDDSLRSCNRPASLRRLSRTLPALRDSLQKQFSRRQHFGDHKLPSSRRPLSIRNLFAVKGNVGVGEHNPRAVSVPTTAKERKEAKKRVAFDNLQFRNYDVLLGDNPCCNKGAAVTIGWSFSEDDPVPVDNFESSRGPRKKLTEMKLSTEERAERLRNSGYTEKEIRKATNAIKEAKLKRARTMANLYKDKRTEKIEGIIKKVRLFAKFKSKEGDDEEGELWTKAQKKRVSK